MEGIRWITSIGYARAAERNWFSVTKNAEFVELFVKLRERAGLSAHALSVQAGLSGSYISKLERGDMFPSVEALAKVALVLNPSPTELYVLVKSMLPKEIIE